MIHFFKRDTKKSACSLKLLFQTDIHSHILPGIDDGAPDISSSIQLLKGLYELGIRKTIATPHVIADLYRNTDLTIQVALDELQLACANENMDIDISAAAEYMLDEYFVNLLNQNIPLLCIYKNLILTELSYATSSENLNEIAFAILSNGYQPILAHPERYVYYHTDYSHYRMLKDMGFLFQVNVLSLTGYYGRSVAKVSKYLFDNDLVDFVGTDLHHIRHLEMLQKKESLALIQKYIGKKIYNQFNDF